MAVFALHGGVRAQQREAILVIFHLLDGDIPALNRVALRAVRAHLPLVNVGMAVLAIPAYIGENWFYMALDALDFFVHAAKRILRFVVIELRHRADGAPTGSRVAVLARNRQGSVRTACVASLTRRYRSAGRPGEKQQPAQDWDARGRNAPYT